MTYAGRPLHYFAKDEQPCDTTGQGINGFGALWWVMSTAGAAIHQPSRSAVAAAEAG